MRARRLVCIALYLTLLSVAWAQQVSLSGLEIVSEGRLTESSNTPFFDTAAQASGRYVPASWIRFNAGAVFLIPDTFDFFRYEPDESEFGFVLFDFASIDFPSIAKSNVNVSVFTGRMEDASSGSLLHTLLKKDFDTPEFREMNAALGMYPDKDTYGHGFTISSLGKSKKIAGLFGSSWNGSMGSDAQFSANACFSTSTPLLTFNAFGSAGISDSGKEYSFTSGLSAILGSNPDAQLYVEASVHDFFPGTSDIDRRVYFLFEPRIRTAAVEWHFSFFISPLFTEESGWTKVQDDSTPYVGINLLSAFGSYEASGMRGGLSVLCFSNPDVVSSSFPVTFSVSPFYGILISDYILKMTAVLRPLDFDNPAGAGELSLSLKAVF